MLQQSKTIQYNLNVKVTVSDSMAIVGCTRSSVTTYAMEEEWTGNQIDKEASLGENTWQR